MRWWQRLTAGNQNIIIQAHSISNTSPYSYSEVREITQDVVRHEIDKFSDTAIETLTQRFEEFVFNYISRQSATAPDGFRSLKDPFMQRALRTAQIEFGATGNTETGETLVEFLVMLSESDPDSLKAICLNEALAIVSKLTRNQVAALTAVFMVSSVRLRSARIETHYDYLRQMVPLASLIPDDQLSYRHMQFAQVGWINPNSIPYPTFGKAVLENFPGLYTQGVTDPNVVPEPLRALMPPIYVRHEIHPERVRLRAVDPDEISDLAREHPVVTPWIDTLKKQMIQSRLPEPEVEAQIVAEIPPLRRLIDVWNRSEISRFELTSIGMVIAHTNWQRMTDGQAIPDLDSLFPDEPRKS